MIHPTVGRKVWYRPSDFDKAGAGAMTFEVGQPLDATVVAVHGERMVNLVVFDFNGNMFKRLSVTLRQDGDSEPQGSAYCEWMPYQTAQAAKTT